MRRVLLAIVAVVMLVASVSAAYAAERPVILLFETTKGDGADKTLAASATRALRTYFRETQKVEVTLFNRDSPTVQRALMEHKLTADKVASYASQNERVDVARLLDFPYAAGAEISVSEKVVTVRLWLAQVDSRKPAKWESSGVSSSIGTGALDMDNAMQSAASIVVLDVARKAFTSLQRIPEAEPATGAESTAIGGSQTPTVTTPTAQDYATEADKNLKAGNIALAISQYSHAVNADPSNPGLRLKLAEAYAHRGMYEEADAAIESAAQHGASSSDVAGARDRIEQIRKADQNPAAATSNPQSSTTPAATTAPATAPATTPQNAIAKLVQGDALWKQGKPDEAAQAYADAIKLQPSEWRAYERLAIVDASMSLFGESRKILEQLNVVQPDPPASVVENRYQMFRKAYDKYFQILLKQYDSDAASFMAKKISRESYYSTINGLSLRLESMAKFLDAVPVPTAKQKASLHRSLACGLMVQASASLLEYLESNSAKAKANADTFAAQARKEADTAEKLEANTVVVKKEEPAPAQPSQPQYQPQPQDYPQDGYSQQEPPYNPQDDGYQEPPPGPYPDQPQDY